MSERLNELKQEVYLQNGIFPPLSEADYQALKDSIRVHGVKQPPILDEELKIIDGRHRIKALLELDGDIKTPCIIVGGLTPTESTELEITLNAARRHLTRQQKRKLGEFELSRDPGRSNRRIAAVCGIHHETVAAIRAEMGQAAAAWTTAGLPRAEAPKNPSLFDPHDDDVAKIERVGGERVFYPVNVEGRVRVDTLGRKQPATRTRKTSIPTVKVIAHGCCPNCQTLIVVKRHDGTDDFEVAA